MGENKIRKNKLENSRQKRNIKVHFSRQSRGVRPTDGLQAAGLKSISSNPFRPNPFLSPQSLSVQQSPPQRLSLLELVLDEESVLMVLRRISPATGSSSNSGDSVVVVVLIQGWSQICSRVGLSEGRRARHHLIICWHSGGGDRKSDENEDFLSLGSTASDSICMDQ